MEKKRFIILLMSCNQPLYLSEEQACRDTFLKVAEGAGIPFYFYRGGEETQFIDTEHVMHLSCPDTLAGTSEKTVTAMAAALQLGDWDYLVKTNVSTWLNIGKIAETIDRWEGRDDLNIYGARFLINKASKDVPFPRGHFTVYSRSTVESVVDTAPKLIAANGFPKTDDTLIGLSCLYHIMKVCGERYQDHIMQVPAVNKWPESLEDTPGLSDAFCIRCKDEKDKERTPDNMRKAHALMQTPPDEWERKGYEPATTFETPYGLSTYGEYAALTTILKRLNDGSQGTSKQDG